MANGYSKTFGEIKQPQILFINGPLDGQRAETRLAANIMPKQYFYAHGPTVHPQGKIVLDVPPPLAIYNLREVVFCNCSEYVYVLTDSESDEVLQKILENYVAPVKNA